mmetsp:Transcript_27647/g.82803  ORF Transcript_27647/g.82803 Transcript_27647/m.82803 type:complete len:150 (-) Transcript_27647:68-517(-)
MSVFQFKRKRFKPAEESEDSSDSDVDDDVFASAMERVGKPDDDDKKGRKKKPAAKKARSPAKKKVIDLESDDDVEALAPIRPVDTKPLDLAASSSDDDETGLDEDTKRRLRMLRESRAAREALKRAERDVEIIDSDDDAPAAPRPGCHV